MLIELFNRWVVKIYLPVYEFLKDLLGPIFLFFYFKDLRGLKSTKHEVLQLLAIFIKPLTSPSGIFRFCNMKKWVASGFTVATKKCGSF